MKAYFKKIVGITVLVAGFTNQGIADSKGPYEPIYKQVKTEEINLSETREKVKAEMLSNKQAAEIAYNSSIEAANLNNFTLARDYIEVAMKLSPLDLDYLALSTDIAFMEGDYDRAEEYQVKMLLVTRSIFGLNDLQVAVVLDQLAVINIAQEHYKDARYRLTEGLHLREQILGENHLLIILSLNKLALLAINQGLPRVAEPLLKRSLDIARKVSGPQHGDSAVLLVGLADFYQSEGRLEEAEVRYKEAISIWKKSSDDSFSRILSQNSLGELFMSQQRFDDARLQFEEVLSQLKKHYKKDHPYIQQAVGNIALLDAEQKKSMTKKLMYDELVRLFSIQMSYYKVDEVNTTSQK